MIDLVFYRRHAHLRWTLFFALLGVLAIFFSASCSGYAGVATDEELIQDCIILKTGQFAHPETGEHMGVLRLQCWYVDKARR